MTLLFLNVEKTVENAIDRNNSGRIWINEQIRDGGGDTEVWNQVS